MIFVAAITTTKNTPKTAPLVTAIPIVAGTINRVLVFFPPGVNALAHLKLLLGVYQLFPSNQEGDFALGGVLIDWAEDIEILEPPVSLTAVTWNTDTANDHTITVHIVVQPASTTPSGAATIADILAAQKGA